MAAKMLFLLICIWSVGNWEFGIASSKLPNIRRCDPERKKDGPTVCSNYKNIEFLDYERVQLHHKQRILEKKIKELEGETIQQLEAVNSKCDMLETKVTKLSSAITDLKKAQLQNEKENKGTKKQLDSHKDEIDDLKQEVQELLRHGEIVGGNFSEIEKKLVSTERELSKKKAELENLEKKTETAFKDTQRLLDQYKNELSQLNTTAQELEATVEARVDATKTELEEKLEQIQNNSKAFSEKLNEQKAEADDFQEETDTKLKNLDKKLKTQKTTVDKQGKDILTLKSHTAGVKSRLGSAEQKLSGLSDLQTKLKGIKSEVNAKVAFSATVIESRGVFTGPAVSRNPLIFDRVITNIGHAYNHNTGIFTAPVKGVYHFTFMTFGYHSHNSGAILVKNGKYEVSTWEFTGPDTSGTTSNAVILELNVKDCVNIILWKGGKIHASVFSGFLVFPTS